MYSINGQVIKKTGNFMPPCKESNGVPLQVPIHIFSGQLETFKEPNINHPQLLQ